MQNLMLHRGGCFQTIFIKSKLKFKIYQKQAGREPKYIKAG